MRDIDDQEGYFVSRLQSQTGLYDPKSGKKFDLACFLRGQAPQVKQVQIACLLGQRVRLAVRLVAHRLPQEIAEKRRRKARATAKKNGKGYSKTYMALLGWDILVTNLSVEDFDFAQIFDLYTIRWHIELVFRTWKSQLKLARIGNWRPARVLCQLLAHLIGAVLMHWFVAPWRWFRGREYSPTKMIAIIQDHMPDLLRAIRRNWYGAQAVFKRIEGDILRFAKTQKRKTSPSTLQILINWG